MKCQLDFTYQYSDRPCDKTKIIVVGLHIS